MRITNEFENKLVGRVEVKGSLRVGESEVTMDRKSLRVALAKKYKSKEGLVVISKIAPHFGDSAVTFSANIYEKEDTKKVYELEHMIKRNTILEPKTQEETETKTESTDTPVEDVTKEETSKKVEPTEPIESVQPNSSDSETTQK